MIEKDAPGDAGTQLLGHAGTEFAQPADREVLHGGVNEVVREGGTVRRPAGPWSATVQRLLAHLAACGFDGAPAPLGLSPNGEEELVTYLPGEVGHDFAAAQVNSDASLVAVARLLRGLHDATASFPRSDADLWYLPAREPGEVICHGDAAPYNTVFRDGLPVAFFDFDTAHPAPRLWDAAYTAYRFVALYAPDEAELTRPAAEGRRRLALFARAYGLTDEQRAALPTVAAERLRAHVALMYAEAAAGNAAFARHLEEGHHRRYLADAEWIERVYGGGLRTARLALRPVRPDDSGRLRGHWTEPEVRRFPAHGARLTDDQIQAEIAASMRSFATHGYGLWLLEAAEDAAQHDEEPCENPACSLDPAAAAARHDRTPATRLLGTVGIRPLDEFGLELCYSLDPGAWGSGYAAEAVRAVAEHAFGALGLSELLAEVDAENLDSAAFVARLGMTPFSVVPGMLGPVTRYRLGRPLTPVGGSVEKCAAS